MLPEPLLLWRGVTMEEYRDGRWHRQRRHEEPLRTQAITRDSRRILQEIKLEPTDSEVLFGLRPIVSAVAAASRRPDPAFNVIDGTIFRAYGRAATFDYRVVSEADPALPQVGEAWAPADRLNRLLEMPSGLRPRLAEIAERVVEGIPPDDVAGRAKALESYLRDSGQFGYTLRLEVVDPALDPVVDFLVNRKEGHCEYFASALTLLLRSVDIPARMVNGFKGGDWNDLTRALSVRQKHAHSWVEAVIDSGPDRPTRWLTLDPTPATERAKSVARVGGFRANFRQLTDLVRFIWVFYVVGYNSERQDKFLYQPIRDLVREARQGFSIMRAGLTKMVANLLQIRDLRLFSVRGFFVSFTVLLVLVGLFRAARWAVLRVVRWLRGEDEEASSHAAGAVYYRRLALILSECGLERPPAETHSEFARRAAVFLSGRDSKSDAVADVPSLVVDAFYRVRFGHFDLSPAEHSDLESRLDDLEGSLGAEQG
jgi:transglutaminase-like putative cysteine protease